jgi:amidase
MMDAIVLLSCKGDLQIPPASCALSSFPPLILRFLSIAYLIAVQRKKPDILILIKNEMALLDVRKIVLMSEHGYQPVTDDGSHTESAYGFASVTALLQALNERRISARELLELYLQRIKRYNPMLNAIVVFNEREAQQSALRADEMRARGENAALLGLPMTIKEAIAVAGLPATAGAPPFAQNRPEKDAHVVERVRAAGAVIMGKTNIPPYLADWQSANPIYGRTNNPWNLAYTPGGSTGGGAAALAAGLTSLELGSDIAGSARVPAAFCGVYGHKPSETALPRSGTFPGATLPNAATVMAVPSLLARDAHGLELAFDVVAGPVVGEDRAWHLHVPVARHGQLADFRVAILPPLAWLPVDAEILAAQEKLVNGLRSRGVQVREASPVGLNDMRDYYSLYLRFLFVMNSRGRSKEDRSQQAAQLHALGDAFPLAVAEGLEASAADYLAWHTQRETYRAAWRAFFREWDVLLAPVNITPAFLHIDGPRSQFSLEINGQNVPYERQSVYPAIATLCGQPATAFPVGLTRAGLPIGLQVIGPYLEDRTPIRFAELVAQEFGGYQRPPGYD